MSYACKEEEIARTLLSILGRKNAQIESVRRTVMKIVFGTDSESVVNETAKDILKIRVLYESKRDKAIDFIRDKLSKPYQSKQNTELLEGKSRTCNRCGIRKNNNDFFSETVSINGVERQVLITCHSCVDLGLLHSLTTIKPPKKHGGVPHNKRHDVYMDRDIIIKLYNGGMFATEIAARYKCSPPLISKIIKGLS